MPKRAGKFRQDAQFTLSAPPPGVDPYIKGFIHRESLILGIPLEKMGDRMALHISMAIESIKQDVGLHGSAPVPVAAVAAAPVAAPAPAVRRNRRGKVITATRSKGAKEAWVTRKAVNQYIKEHPGVSRPDALAAVTANQPGRTRVVADGPRDKRGQKAWDTRVERVLAAAAERGETITREEAHKVVARQIRGKRDENAAEQKKAA